MGGDRERDTERVRGGERERQRERESHSYWHTLVPSTEVNREIFKCRECFSGFAVSLTGLRARCRLEKPSEVSRMRRWQVELMHAPPKSRTSQSIYLQQ